jgi:hypothetical protein
LNYTRKYYASYAKFFQIQAEELLLHEKKRPNVPLSVLLLFLLLGYKNPNLKPTMLSPSIDLTTTALAEIPSVKGPF